MPITTVSPDQAAQLVHEGAMLVDVRALDEHARERIEQAECRPLDALGGGLGDGVTPIVFHCRTGMRTGANAARLEAVAGGVPCYLMAGGIDAWKGAGLPTVRDARAPLEMMRQVQIAAGLLILLGVLAGWLVAPAFYGLAAFVGAGLTFAGVSGFCGMARLLSAMPWNRRALAG